MRYKTLVNTVKHYRMLNTNLMVNLFFKVPYHSKFNQFRWNVLYILLVHQLGPYPIVHEVTKTRNAFFRVKNMTNKDCRGSLF